MEQAVAKHGLKLVISSHTRSFLALAHLLESLRVLQEFPQQEIIVAVGGHYSLPDYEVERVENVTYVRCNHNSMSFTGLNMLLDLFHDDEDARYMYVHDTTRAGPEFLKRLQAIDVSGSSSMKIKTRSSMNMGIYSQRVINGFEHFLKSKRNTDPNPATLLRLITYDYAEDYLFENDAQNQVIGDYSGDISTGPVNYYGNGVPRIVEYYPALDLYKMKSNWCETRPRNLDN